MRRERWSKTQGEEGGSGLVVKRRSYFANTARGLIYESTAYAHEIKKDEMPSASHSRLSTTILFLFHSSAVIVHAGLTSDPFSIQLTHMVN